MPNISKIATEIETQKINIEQAKAILAEAYDYFTYTDKYDSLPRYASHICNLLGAVIDYLHNATPELEKLTDDLFVSLKAIRAAIEGGAGNG